jgi:hypothetical protein
MKLVIDRERWQNGSKPGRSMLLNTGNGRMCCIGFYMLACGATEAQIEDTSTPCDMWLNEIPSEARWLVNTIEVPLRNDSSACTRLVTQNDNQVVTESVREQGITEEFAKHGVEVEFIDRLEGEANVQQTQL